MSKKSQSSRLPADERTIHVHVKVDSPAWLLLPKMRPAIIKTLKYLPTAAKSELDLIASNLGEDVEAVYMKVYRLACKEAFDTPSDVAEMLEDPWWSRHKEQIEVHSKSKKAFLAFVPHLQSALRTVQRGVSSEVIEKQFVERMSADLSEATYALRTHWDEWHPFTTAEMKKALKLAAPALEVFVTQRVKEIENRRIEREINAAGLQEPSAVHVKVGSLKVWRGTKSEFARFINEEHQKYPSRYRSKRDAAYKIFDQFDFPKLRWTKESCYDLVRKT